MHPHIHTDPKPAIPPHDRSATPESPDPDRERESLAAQPRGEPLKEGAAGERWERTREGRDLTAASIVLVVDLDRATRMQQEVDGPIDEGPGRDADEPERGKCGPGIRDPEMMLEVVEGGEGKSAVSGAEKGFGSRFDERGECDGVFADAEPADAAGGVGGEAHVADGLDG